MPTGSGDLTQERLDLARVAACGDGDPLPCTTLKKRDALRLFAARCRELRGTRCDDPLPVVLDDLAAACRALGAECAALPSAKRTAACRTAFGAPPPCPFEDALADRPNRRLAHSLVREPPVQASWFEVPANGTSTAPLPPPADPTLPLMPLIDGRAPVRFLFAALDAARQAGYTRFVLAVHRASAAIGDGLPETCPREGVIELLGASDAAAGDAAPREQIRVDVSADGTVTLDGATPIPPATAGSASAKRERTGACFEPSPSRFDDCAYWTWVEEYLDTCIRKTSPGPIPDFKAYHLALRELADRAAAADAAAGTAPAALVLRPEDEVMTCTVVALLDLARFRDFAGTTAPLFPDARLEAPDGGP
jgi:hypothetical protein